MQFRHARVRIESAGVERDYLLLPGKPNFFDELYVDFQVEDQDEGRRYHVFLHPKQDLVVRRLELEFQVELGPATRFFANGYQSWSESRALPVAAGISPLRPAARPFMGFYGDTHIPGIPYVSGRLHAWSFTYLTDDQRRFQVFRSLNESTGFTLFLLDQAAGRLVARKDLDGLALSHSFPALDIWAGTSNRPFGAFTPSEKPALGWTSWYQYYTNITEDIILKNADALAASGLPFRYLQIDDGWQTAIGDWRSVKPSFPGGMGRLAAAIRARGLTPGLWLAPFVASATSALARRHPEWLLKNTDGRPLRAGWNPLWGGWYYALNPYHPGVQEYLSGVFHVILDQWGYELVKLDFLFAACLQPPPGKTRGQVMHDAMAFLRKQVGSRKMLACGVPLGSATGLADFCRISGDIHLRWEHRLLAFLRHRERVSTLSALRTTLNRWALHGHGFLNDPDVFILRREKQHLTPVQQHTVLTINALLGGLLFTSDDVSAYTRAQYAMLESALARSGSRINAVSELANDVYKIDFEQDGNSGTLLCNLNGRPQKIALENGRQVALGAFETKEDQRVGLASGPAPV